MGYGTPTERYAFVTRRLKHAKADDASDAFLAGLKAGVSRCTAMKS